MNTQPIFSSLRRHSPGLYMNRISLGVFTLLSAVLAFVVLSSQMLSPLLIILVIGIIAIFLVVTWVLSLFRPNFIRQTIASILAIIFSLVFACGIYYLQITINALKDITSGGTETAEMVVCVRIDEQRELEDLLRERWGVLEEIDSHNTKAALLKIQEEFYITVNTKSYSSTADLVDALLEEEINVILVNRAYLDILTELETYQNLNSQIREVTFLPVSLTDDTEGPTPIPLPSRPTSSQAYEETFTVYISGSDSRNSAILATGRSDVNIIATVNPKTRQILLLSTPRDYYVPLSIASPGDLPDKLTHAGIYGIEVSQDTLAELYGIDIDYYFRVNFTGFEDIIDALGGIEVNSQYAFSSSGYHFQQGINYMDGKKALAYVRERYAFPNGDYQRGIHQMQVITAVIQKATSPEVLTQYSSLVDAVTNSFITSVPYTLLSALVRDHLQNNQNWNVNSYYVTGTASSEYTYSIPGAKAYVTIPDPDSVETAKELMRNVRLGLTISTP